MICVIQPSEPSVHVQHTVLVSAAGADELTLGEGKMETSALWVKPQMVRRGNRMKESNKPKNEAGP